MVVQHEICRTNLKKKAMETCKIIYNKHFECHNFDIIKDVWSGKLTVLLHIKTNLPLKFILLYLSYFPSI